MSDLEREWRGSEPAGESAVLREETGYIAGVFADLDLDDDFVVSGAMIMVKFMKPDGSVGRQWWSRGMSQDERVGMMEWVKHDTFADNREADEE